MQGTWRVGVLLGTMLISVALHCQGLSHNGTNVCNGMCKRTFKERVQSYKRCGLFGWRRCAHYTYQVVVHNETCYQCCPGWLQSDSDNCNTQEPCPTGSAGIRTCADLPDGNYQSCDRCHVYSACSAGHLVDNKPCCCGLMWDDEIKRCEWKSKTCTTTHDTKTTPAPTTVHVTSPQAHLPTEDPDGINCGPHTGCWVRYRFRYDDNWNECHGEQYVRRSGHTFAKYVGVVLCTPLRYKLFLGDHVKAVFQNIADGNGDGRDHCEFVGGLQCQKGVRVASGFWKAPLVYGFYRDEWGEEPRYGAVGRGWFAGPDTTIRRGPSTDTGRYYVKWYECRVSIPGNNTVVEYAIDFSTTQRNVSKAMLRTSHKGTHVHTTTEEMSTTHRIVSTTHRVTTTSVPPPLDLTTTPPSSDYSQKHKRLTGSERGSGSGSDSGSATGRFSSTCDVIVCPAPSVCADLYGDDEDEPFSKCVCPPGMATILEDPAQCVEVDECMSNPCQNSGHCLDRRGGYVCDCAPGWQGHHCQNVQFIESQRPLCNHCVDYERLAGSCSGRYCECRKGYYNTYTCLPEVSQCTVLRNQSQARGRPELMIDRAMGVVYSCVPSEKPHPITQATPFVRKHEPLYEVHALAIYRSTKGSVLVNVTWPEGDAEETNTFPSYHSFVMLALSNYWPTSWTVVIPAWRQLIEVIVFSHAHRNTTVTVRRGSPTGGLVPVNTFHLHPASYPPGFGDDTHMDTNTPAMLQYLYKQHGSIASFTGTYQADRWQLNVGQHKRNS